MLSVMIVIAAFASHLGATKPTAQTCITQSVPSAIDRLSMATVVTDSIEFAATPSGHYPGQAWVVRLTRQGEAEAAIEIIRLRMQISCNRYDIERRWGAPLRQQEYYQVAAKAAPSGIPPFNIFANPHADDEREIVLDGTEINLRFHSGGWQVNRSISEQGKVGRTISKIFRNLISKYIPAKELPTVDWRTVPDHKGRFGTTAK